MPRPKKDGIEYFSVDVDFFEDDKIKLLRAEFGAKGVYILMYLLCQIYKNGYYISWDDDKCLLASDGAGCGCTPGFVQELVNGCFKRSFFDKGVFDMFGILTSRGIQRRFLYAVMTRPEIRVIQEYFLLGDEFEELPRSIQQKIIFKSINLKENRVNLKEIPVNFEEKQTFKKNTVNLKETRVNFKSMQQSKVKESKVKESKVVCGKFQIPCKNGTFVVDEDYYTELTHTYPNMNIDESLKKFIDFMASNPEKQRYLNGIKGSIQWWLNGDEEKGRYRKSSIPNDIQFKGGLNL